MRNAHTRHELVTWWVWAELVELSEAVGPYRSVAFSLCVSVVVKRFIDDLEDGIKNMVDKFADDTKVLAQVHSDAERTKLQEDLDIN